MDKKMNYYGPGGDKGGIYQTATFPGANFAPQPTGFTAAALAPGSAPATHRHVAVSQSYAPSGGISGGIPGSAPAYNPSAGVYSALASTPSGYPSATGAFHSPAAQQAQAQAMQYQQLQQQGLIPSTSPSAYPHSQYPSAAYIGAPQLTPSATAAGYPVGIAVTSGLQHPGLGPPLQSVPNAQQRYTAVSQMGYPAALASNPNYPQSPYGVPSPYPGAPGSNYY